MQNLDMPENVNQKNADFFFESMIQICLKLTEQTVLW